jgi:RNA polymerase sigma factor for flagellar operon FliA
MARTREDVTKIWQQFKAHGDEASRNTLLETYLPIVRYVAERIIEKLPQNVDVQDLMSAGIFGLADAIDRFDLSRGVKFETYCTSRIRGAILDELRAMDWVPRLVRARLHQLENAYLKLERELGRAPTDGELSRELGVSLEGLDGLLREVSAATVVAVCRRTLEKDDTLAPPTLETVEDKRDADPSRVAQKRELIEYITRGISRKEKLILLLYYYEELTFREIGLTLGLSESRVSQLHSKILLRLRTQLRKKAGTLM